MALFVPERQKVKLARISHFSHAYRSFGPNVIFAHSVLPALYGRLVFARQSKFVSVLHSASEDDYEQLAFRVTESLLTYRTDAIIAVSELGAKNYRRRFPNGARPIIIQNGIDLRPFVGVRHMREACRRELGMSGRTRLILQIGRLSEVKGQFFTLGALSSLLHAEDDVCLWFAGLVEDLEYADALAEAIMSANLSNQVKVLGSRDDVPQLLACADVYVMPSLQEAHSIAMIEALASGIPIVASTIPNFEFAARLPAVSLVKPNDVSAFQQAVRAALAMPRAERDLGAFDISRTAQQYLDLAKGLLSEPVT